MKSSALRALDYGNLQGSQVPHNAEVLLCGCICRVAGPDSKQSFQMVLCFKQPWNLPCCGFLAQSHINDPFFFQLFSKRIRAATLQDSS